MSGQLHFDLTDLRLFAAVAAHGSITKAAESLPIALGAASIRVKGMEESLGTPLLDRHSRGVALTPAGEVFLDRAISILHETSKLRGELAQIRQGSRGRVRLFANTNAMHEYLPSLLARFLALNPHISVSADEHNSPDIVRAVDEGEADLGIVVHNNCNTRELTVRPFRIDRLVVIAPPGHELDTGKPTRFARAAECQFIGLADRCSHQQFITKTALMLGQTIRFRTQADTFEGVCHMVAAGVGISIVPQSTARRLQASLALATVPLDEPWSHRELNIVHRADVPLTPHTRKLVDALLEDRHPEGITPATGSAPES